jgi:peptidoglycan/LPS O-acetylase OafA/YrhL
VVAFHAGLGPLSGGFVGVDVFFVISGFLITGLLVDELHRTGTIDLPRFYARRIRRLLPMAALVLVTTAVVFRPLLAPIDRPGLGKDLTAAALWTANWRFAAGATDYLGTVDSSPVLHYWSLSVEEQFYLCWPLLLLALLWIGGRPRRWQVVCRRFATGLAGLAAASFVASALTTAGSGPWAWFGLHTRGWELAAGGLLAMARPQLPALPRLAAVLSGWSGLAIVFGSALILDRESSFPGTAAFWPVAGAVLIVAGGTRTTDGPAGLLGVPALTHLGRLSYAWYLWHWPCLVAVRMLAESRTPGADPDLPAGPAPRWAIVLALAVSLGLAHASHRLVEQPVRQAPGLLRSWERTLAVGAGLLVTATVLPWLVLQTPEPAVRAVAAAGTGAAPAAVAGSIVTSADAAASAPTTGAWPAPGRRVARMTPQQARTDDAAPSRCFLGFAAVEVDPGCRFGDPDAGRVVVLIGDSHAAQWFPALAAAASRRHWTLWFWAKSGCGYADAPQWLEAFHRIYTECAAWRSAVLARIARLPRVDTVLVGRNYAQFSKLVDASRRMLPAPAAAAAWAAGAARTLAALHSSARSVVLLRDTPRPITDTPACLSRHPGAAERCGYPRAGHLALDAAVYASERAAVAADGVRVVDLGDLVCATDPCPVVSTSGAIMFRDGHHLTATFARERTPAVAQRLLA